MSDSCVATGKPLVSGAALGLEGQVFDFIPMLSVCSTGHHWNFQALEALKIASGVGEALNSRTLLLDALSTRIHIVKLRGRNPKFITCGDAPQICASNLHDYDYERFTQSALTEEEPKAQRLILDSDRISAEGLKKRLDWGKAYVLLHVRGRHEFAISSLPNPLNIPLSSLKEKLSVLQLEVMVPVCQVMLCPPHSLSVGGEMPHRRLCSC